MVALEQFLIVALVALMIVAVACGVVAVVLLRKGLAANQTGRHSEDEEGSEPVKTGGQAEAHSTRTRIRQTEVQVAQMEKAQQQRAATMALARKQLELSERRVAQAQIDVERAFRRHRIDQARAIRQHDRAVQELSKAYVALEAARANFSFREAASPEEETPTIKASDDKVLTHTHQKIILDAKTSALHGYSGGALHSAAPA